jgi:NAD(P)-dependent dehydrogenase (short-subunit alcohol dehydrogenase family)
VPADLALVEDCRNVIKEADASFGGVDILVNAAAITDRGSIIDTEPELFDRMFAINVRAPFFLMQDAIKLMRRDSVEGAIVNIGSMSARAGQSFLSAYSASKGALATLTRNTAYSLLRNRIRVNGLNIGWMASEGEDRIQREGAGEQLARAADLVLGVADHLVQLGDPADRAGQREDRGEQAHRDADGALHDAGVEVDVRVQLARDEVLVFQRDLLQGHGQLEQRVVLQAQLGQHFVAGLAHQLGARVVVLVHAVAEAHQLDAGVLVLDLGHELADLGHAAHLLDVFQHVQRRFVGAAVRRAPQAGHAGRDGGERVGARGAAQAHRGGGGVLLVVGVQDEDAVHRAHQHVVRLVLLARRGEHHAHEVRRCTTASSSGRCRAGRWCTCRPWPPASASWRSGGSRRSRGARDC